MAGVSDKARFYQEQSVSELRDWERREIFTRDEIAKITRKRSDFEHIVNSRESSPADFVRYVEYEMKIDMLRRKRVKRLGIKAKAYTGRRKIFHVLDRATRKFHGDVGLWIQYLEYAQKQKANKKLNSILADALRLHPTKPELWIYAARHAMDVQADIVSARTYMQRSLRFCKSSKTLYLEYAKLEMTYIAKLDARHAILGIGNAQTATPGVKLEDESATGLIRLPSADDLDHHNAQMKLSSFTPAALHSSTVGQVLDGAIPIAIFDAATTQFPSDDDLTESFFDMFAGSAQIPCTRKILWHVVEYQSSTMPLSPSSQSCLCRFPVIGLASQSIEFLSAFRETLKTINSALSKTDDPPKLARKLLLWLLPLHATDDLLPEVTEILASTARKLREITRALPAAV